MRLTQATGDFYGVQISASGKLLHPELLSPMVRPRPGRKSSAAASGSAPSPTKSKRCEARRAPPTLEIRFQGDLAQPGTLRAFAQLQGDALRRGGYRLERLRVQLDYAAGAFHLRQTELTDTHGTLAAQGDFNPIDGVICAIQLQSGLDLMAMAREFVDPAARGTGAL